MRGVGILDDLFRKVFRFGMHACSKNEPGDSIDKLLAGMLLLQPGLGYFYTFFFVAGIFTGITRVM